MNLLWLMDPPSELKIDALHTATPNLADEPTLANGPPQVLTSSGPHLQFYIATDI